MATRLSRYRAASPASLECRRGERLFVAVRRIAVDVAGDPATEAVLGDVSSFGCRLEVSGSWAAGEPLSLRIGGGMEVAATVVWGGDGVVGCRFDQPMPRATLRPLTLRV